MRPQRQRQQPRGRPSKEQLPQARKVERQKQRVAELFEYRYLFVRHHLSPAYIDTTNPLYLEATTLTYVTLVLCLYVYLLFERADTHEKFFTSYLWSNKKLLGAFGLSLVLIGGIVYTPFLHGYFSTANLGWGEWFSALLAAGAYFAFRLAQRHTRKHTRRAVLKLHHEVHSVA